MDKCRYCKSKTAEDVCFVCTKKLSILLAKIPIPENLLPREKILEAIQRKGWEVFSVRDLQLAARTRNLFKEVSQVKEVLDSLEERGYVLKLPPTYSPGRPSMFYVRTEKKYESIIQNDIQQLKEIL